MCLNLVGPASPESLVSQMVCSPSSICSSRARSGRSPAWVGRWTMTKCSSAMSPTRTRMTPRGRWRWAETSAMDSAPAGHRIGADPSRVGCWLMVGAGHGGASSDGPAVTPAWLLLTSFRAGMLDDGGPLMASGGSWRKGGLELGPQRGGEDVTGAADQHGHLVGDHAHVARGASPLGDRDWESIGRHDPGVGHPWGALGEVVNQPAEVAGFAGSAGCRGATMSNEAAERSPGNNRRPALAIRCLVGLGDRTLAA